MATTDMDLFLGLREFDFERESSHDMDDDLDDNGHNDNGLNHTGLDLSCLVKNGHYDNMNFDPFINDRNGGQGSLDFHANPYGPVSHSMPHNSVFPHEHQEPGIPGLDGHSSSENSQQFQEQNQLVFPSRHVDHSSGHGAEQYQDPSGMLVDGEVEEIVDSIEQGQDAHEEASEEDKVLLKHEEHDSDEEFKDEDEEEEAAEEDEDDEDGQKKKKQKQKRQPYKQTRILTHWDTSVDQLTLLALIYILERENIQVPYEELNLMVNGGANWSDDCGGPVGQHLTKVRKARIFFGMPVPPAKKNKRGAVDTPKIPSEKEIKTYHSLTYTRPGRENKMTGTPGTMEAIYVPVPIPGRPDLPIYDLAYDPPMGPLPAGFVYPDYTPYAHASKAKKAAPTSDKKQVNSLKSSAEEGEEGDAPVPSTEKKGRSTKKVVKAEDDDDAESGSVKPTRKGKSTPALSKRKAAAKADSTATPSKPKGLPKSRSKKTLASLKKTPGTMVKMAESLEGKLDLAATPSKKGKAIQKAESDAAPEMLPAESGPVAINEEEQPLQNFGRVNMDAVSMPAQSLRNMRAGLPPNKFRMGNHQPNQSFDSQSTMSTGPSLSILNSPIQFMPNGFDQSQNNFAGNGYNQQMMAGPGPSFAHNHDMQRMQELENMNPQEVREKVIRLEKLQAAAGGMQQYNNSHGLGNVQVYGNAQTRGNFQAYGNAQARGNVQTRGHGHSNGPHGLGIVNASAMMPSAHNLFDTEMGDYGYASGPASNLPVQQNLFTNDYGLMQNDGNDTKPNMELYSGNFDIPEFDASGLFNNN